jgi:hypothetical protein
VRKSIANWTETTAALTFPPVVRNTQQDAVTVPIESNQGRYTAEWVHGHDGISILEHAWFIDQCICGHASAEK